MFEVTEELVCIEYLQARIFKKDCKKALTQYCMRWNLLRYVITEGGKNMCGAGIDLIGQI